MCSRKPTPRMRSITRRSRHRRRSCFHRRKWASSSRCWPSAARATRRSSASAAASAVPAFSAVLMLALLASAALADEVQDARRRWAESPHGALLERILPPTFEPEMLPERGSPGARLMPRYCVQCHNLPNPAMHEAAKWPGIVERMVLRMQGHGNLGELMNDMMAGASAPARQETETLLACRRRHAQKPLDVRRYPDLEQPEGEAYR